MEQSRDITGGPNAHITLADVALISLGVPAVGVTASAATHVTMTNVDGVNVHVDVSGGPLTVRGSSFTWDLPFGSALRPLVYAADADVTMHQVYLSGLHGTDAGGCLVAEALTSLRVTEATIANCSAQV